MRHVQALGQGAQIALWAVVMNQVFLEKSLMVILYGSYVSLGMLLVQVVVRLLRLRRLLLDRRVLGLLRRGSLAGQIQMLSRDLSQCFERG